MMGNTRGFTIIEVMLFLGVSSLLFLIAMTYMSSTIRETSFTDDTNQLTAFMQRQYLTVKRSQATRGNDVAAKCDASELTAKVPGASDSCMVLGKLLYFNQASATISVSTIVGDAKIASAPTELETIRALRPRLLANSASVTVDESFPFSTNLNLSQQLYKSGPTTSSAFDAIALVRSPISENVYLASWQTTPLNAGSLVSTYNNGATGIISKFTSVAGTYPNIDKPILICVKENGITNRRAAVQVPSGQAVDRITKVVGVKDQTLHAGMTCDQ